MRVTRLLISNFRGWKSLDLRPRDHVVLAGVPRAGRSDIVEALARVLDPDAAQSPRLSDLHQEPPAAAQADASDDDELALEDDGDSGVAPCETEPFARADFAEVEVTLTDLDPAIEQLVDGHLQPLDPSGATAESDEADPTASQCVRIAYRLSYDIEAETWESAVYALRLRPSMRRRRPLRWAKS
ncbi:hypothetical protein ACFVVL_23150 [Kitasatospora sp. NPDC058115]|uniref:hypothetical protein n=1 Tax=Kitasatospora sp. NPDC058115 TaxID=3346347 RepID=UPI0036DDC5C8